MWLELKHIILLSSVLIVGPAIGLDIGSGDYDDIGSGNDVIYDSDFVDILSNKINNSSKEGVINVSNHDGGSTYDGGDQLYVEVVDASGSGDEDDFSENNLLEDVVIDDGDDIGSGQDQVSHEESNGSGTGDDNDDNSIDKNEVIVGALGGDVVEGYRIMGSPELVPADSIEDNESKDDELSLEVNIQVADNSNGSFGEIKVDYGDVLSNGIIPTNASSMKPEMDEFDNIASDDEEDVIKSSGFVLLETTSSVNEELTTTDPGDDFGFLRMIASKNEEVAVEANVSSEADEQEHDVNKILDYFNSIEPPSDNQAHDVENILDYFNSIEPPSDEQEHDVNDILDYFNSIESATALTASSPIDNIQMKGKFDHGAIKPSSKPITISSGANILSSSLIFLISAIIVCLII